VARTMAENITVMDAEQGFVASLVTAILVILASYAGLPVSTTHVSVGALFGIAMANRIAKLRTVATILVAWVTTLPLAASIAAGLYVGMSLAAPVPTVGRHRRSGADAGSMTDSKPCCRLLAVVAAPTAGRSGCPCSALRSQSLPRQALTSESRSRKSATTTSGLCGCSGVAGKICASHCGFQSAPL
jgi:hypothetical protein